MSAKRELSSTLRNLKFMQRAMTKPNQEESKEEELDQKPKVDAGFGVTLVRKCKVVMEGNPHPGAVKGRMSFQGFNPNIDKLNQEAAESSKPQASFSSTERQNGESSTRSNLNMNGENGSLTKPNNATESDHKRKKPEIESETSSTPISRNLNADGDGQLSSETSGRNSQNQQKRGKLDWNVLRREKANVKRG